MLDNPSIYGALILEHVYNETSYFPEIIQSASDVDTLVIQIAKQAFLDESEKKALGFFLKANPSQYQALKEERWEFSLGEYDAKQLAAVDKTLQDKFTKDYPFEISILKKEVDSIKPYCKPDAMGKTQFAIGEAADPAIHLIYWLYHRILVEPKESDPIKNIFLCKRVCRENFNKTSVLDLQNRIVRTPQIGKFLGYLDHQVVRMKHMREKIAELQKDALRLPSPPAQPLRVPPEPTLTIFSRLPSSPKREGPPHVEVEEERKLDVDRAPNRRRRAQVKEDGSPQAPATPTDNAAKRSLPPGYTLARFRFPNESLPSKRDGSPLLGGEIERKRAIAEDPALIRPDHSAPKGPPPAQEVGQGSPPPEDENEPPKTHGVLQKLYGTLQKVSDFFTYILKRIAAFFGRIKHAWNGRNAPSVLVRIPSGPA